MNKKDIRVFRFNVPSTLSLMWQFEFQCTFIRSSTEPLRVRVHEHMIGDVGLVPPPYDAQWKVYLWVWEQCHNLAFSHAFEMNVCDATR